MSGPYYAAGRHAVTISEIAFGETKNNDPQIMVRFHVDAFVEADGSETPLQQGYPRTAYLGCSEESREYTIAKLRNAGWEGSNFQTLKSDMQNRSCYANCKHEIQKSSNPKYDGQLGEKWDLSLPRKDVKPLEDKPGIDRKLNALFAKELKGSKPAKPAMSPAHSAAVNAQSPNGSSVGTLPPYGDAPPDDDVPF